MREQSHKDEMARALRGDFARLRARGVATTLEPVDGGVAGEMAPADTPDPPPAEARPTLVPTPLPERAAPSDVAPHAPVVAADGEPEAVVAPPVEAASPSLLRRVLGRR